MGKTCYIAGPMRGYDLFNFPAFDDAQKRIEARGWTVFSPAAMDRAKGFDPSKHSDEEWAEFFPGGAAEVIGRDLDAIRVSDAIILLPGWGNSKGVAVELAYAQFLDKKVLYYWAIENGRCVLRQDGIMAEIVEKVNTERDSSVGLRKNEGKPHVELCPGIVNELIGTVLWESAAPRGKYEMHNWRKGLKWNEEVLGSLGRHYDALKEGEDIDKESGLPHIAHLLTNGMFLAYYMEHGLGEDDRPVARPCDTTCKWFGDGAECHKDGIPKRACARYAPHTVSEVEAIGGENCGDKVPKLDCKKCYHYNGGLGISGKCVDINMRTCWKPVGA